MCAGTVFAQTNRTDEAAGGDQLGHYEAVGPDEEELVEDKGLGELYMETVEPPSDGDSPIRDALSPVDLSLEADREGDQQPPKKPPPEPVDPLPERQRYLEAMAERLADYRFQINEWKRTQVATGTAAPARLRDVRSAWERTEARYDELGGALTSPEWEKAQAAFVSALTNLMQAVYKLEAQ